MPFAAYFLTLSIARFVSQLTTGVILQDSVNSNGCTGCRSIVSVPPLLGSPADQEQQEGQTLHRL
jgi:hypothetical protein